MPNNYLKQIELEKRMTQCSIDSYRKELERAKQDNNFSCSSVATQFISGILDDYANKIREYLADYSKGKAIRSTLAADVILRLNDIDATAYITSKIIFNSMWSKIPVQAIYKAIGQAIEDEYKMREFKAENKYYYNTIQEDLNKRGAKANRKKNITMGVFNKRLDFHLDRWTVTEKAQTGLVLTALFEATTGLVEYEDVFKQRKHYKFLIPSQELVDWMENMNERLEVMQPLFLPMVCPPKEWTSVLEGGYISPYLKKNKLIKNNDKDYLKKLESAKMPIVYKAINHIQNTAWQINKQVLDTVTALWEEGKAIAELPDREDELLIPYPYPDKNTKTDSYTQEEIEVIKKWKRDTYEIHKRNVQKRSIRLLVSQIIRIANQFVVYDAIWFPYQMDFRGRLYPIPVLLQPQGSDLAKGLLQFSEGKPLDEEALKWFQIHGANVYGYDKESYSKRIEWVKNRQEEIRSYAKRPLINRGWAEADKPFQFLAWCFEYNEYLNHPKDYVSHIPIQLDGTCNGLQHYSALLRDSTGGAAVNLINADKPADIYTTVAEKLKEELKNVRHKDADNDKRFALLWFSFINRKLTKRPVMVLPYGGTLLSCRGYIEQYLLDNYSPNYIWQYFGIGDNPADCIFKASVWLSKYLWEAIKNTLQAAITGMAYLRKLAGIITKEKQYIEWLSPAGLLIRQSYSSRKQKEIKTELYGSILKSRFTLDLNRIDTHRQLNGICPNFIHSLDASCLMLYLNKCKKANINSIMAVHDCYGVLAADTAISARLLREAFVELYKQPILENFTDDIFQVLGGKKLEIPEIPKKGTLEIEDVLNSDYFFN